MAPVVLSVRVFLRRRVLREPFSIDDVRPVSLAASPGVRARRDLGTRGGPDAAERLAPVPAGGDPGRLDDAASAARGGSVASTRDGGDRAGVWCAVVHVVFATAVRG